MTDLSHRPPLAPAGSALRVAHDAAAALARARETLLKARTAGGFWSGELSSSALSTATAVTALALVGRGPGPTGQPRQPANGAAAANPALSDRMARGLDWLVRNQNPDGGWGDTTRSLSNISTTTLCWAAFGAVAGADNLHRDAVRRAADWLSAKAGGPEPDRLARAIIARYGRDRTFSVPILTLCALAGRLGTGPEAWRQVIALPFELAALPHRFFAALRLPVVSYALPALIAIGQARHHHAPSANPIARWIRNLTRARTLRVLETLQPTNGGFLEATPLTSFVTLSLAGCGLAQHPVARKGVAFLEASQRPDGSWPIDTNLATWVTTLAVNALSPEASPAHPSDSIDPQGAIRAWLLGQQYRSIHPYTQAAPGGWAWTDLPGGVPDADDTAGALLALRRLGPVDHPSREAALAGLGWLLDLQNTDGGVPTFCRGWGALPFDRSSADITAHALRAWREWEPDVPAAWQRRLQRARRRAIQFLAQTRAEDGSWCPLWFGNQFAPDDINPTYGTARVLPALAGEAVAPGPAAPTAARLARDAASWLIRIQNPDGGWGGAAGIPSSTEETALAVEGLAALGPSIAPAELPDSLRRGVDWLAHRVQSGAWTEPAPIGFYFAKLWYYEQLYPLIFTMGALRQASSRPGASTR